MASPSEGRTAARCWTCFPTSVGGVPCSESVFWGAGHGRDRYRHRTRTWLWASWNPGGARICGWDASCESHRAATKGPTRRNGRKRREHTHPQLDPDEQYGLMGLPRSSKYYSPLFSLVRMGQTDDAPDNAGLCADESWPVDLDWHTGVVTVRIERALQLQALLRARFELGIGRTLITRRHPSSCSTSEPRLRVLRGPPRDQRCCLMSAVSLTTTTTSAPAPF
jgi:hypothetical protein